MDNTTARRIANRFAALPPEQQRTFLARMREQNISFGQLPIPGGAPFGVPHPLSYAQQRQWYLWQLEPQSSAYHLPAALHLRGELDESALRSSFTRLLARHPSLRTRFVEVDGVPAQVVDDHASLVLDVVPAAPRFQTLAGAEREAALRCWVEAEVARPFDLAVGPLLRVVVLRLAPEEHLLVVTLHHIAADGESLGVLLEEFAVCYASARRGESIQLPELPIQYLDYSLWQRRWMEAGELDQQLAWWTRALGTEQIMLELPLDRPRSMRPSNQGARLTLALAAPLTASLKALARTQGTTLFTLLLASFQVLLHRYSGQADLRVGVPVANRGRPELRGMVGFFVNTQVIAAHLKTRQAFSAFLQETHQRVLDAQEHQELPFERLVQALREEGAAQAPLFQVLFNHQATSAGAGQLVLDGLKVTTLDWQAQATQFDLQLDTLEEGDRLGATFTYASELFDASRIERLAGHWRQLLEGLVADPNQALTDLPLLDPGQRHEAIRDRHAQSELLATARCLPQAFEEWATRAGERPALCFGESTLTYTELNSRANRLAHRLRAEGVGPEVLVGVACERSLELVVALLAILKAGGAYVPLDPDYPTERLAYLMEDSAIGLLLTQQRLCDRLPLPAGLRVLELDAESDPAADFPATNPAPLACLENLAYVIYTSGSTGRPKGAGNRHLALHNRLAWMQNAYRLTPGDRVLQKTPFGFDVSVWEFFWPLQEGATLVLALPGEHRDPERLARFIEAQRVTTVHFVPSMLQAFLGADTARHCRGLRRVICSGEALSVELQRQVLDTLPDSELYNLYGPTEAAIDVTHWTCRRESRDSVPIGHPIANLRTLVLDAELQPVPAGVTGELYLGGVGLARGYHRRPGLTAERFVVDPFVAGGRLYRTGDLARQRADGALEYCGRIDHQVKIRGLRIELGEIEARLLEHPLVREAVVAAQWVGAGRQLIAYIVPASAPLPSEASSAAWRETLRKHLALTLPDFMVPVHWISMVALPLGPNGKLERKALPVPDVDKVQRAYAPPQGQHEIALAQIWQEVLGVERVGRADNFFELGGDSIVSIQVVSRARRVGLRLTPRDLFQQPNLQALAAAAGEWTIQEQQLPASGAQQLLPIHHWFFSQPIPRRDHWNQSVLLDIREPLAADRLEQALGRLVAHHDALRLAFVEGGGTWQASYRPWTPPVSGAELLWRATTGSDTELSCLCDEAQASLSLTDGPLLRAVLVEHVDGRQRLLLVIHHLAVDGVSWRILLEDLHAAYAGQALPERTTSLQAWAARLDGYARSQALEIELPFWEALLSQGDPVLPGASAAAGSLRGSLNLEMDEVLTRALLQEAPAAYRTHARELLLTALAVALRDWSGCASALVQLEGHGREDLFEDLDLSRTLGWFTSLYPVRLEPAATLGQSIKAIKAHLRAIPANGLGFGLLRYLGSAAHRKRLAALPEPRITFNYLGQFDQSFSADDPWVPARESSGRAQADGAPVGNWLVIDGQVYGGRLQLDWSFSREHLAEADVAALADRFRQALEAVITHCLDESNGGVTPADFPLAQLDQAGLDVLSLPPRQIQNLYPVTPLQAGLLFHSLYEPSEEAYVNQLVTQVRGLDVERFAAAWRSTLAAHDILRTTFLWPAGSDQPLQAVWRDLDLPLTVLSLEEGAPHDKALWELATVQRQGLDPAKAPLLRLLLVRLAPDVHQLIYTHHHLLLDGWSNSLLLGEVLQRYAGEPVSQISGRFADHVAWLQKRDSTQDERFWREQLAELAEPTRLAQSLTELASADDEGYGDWRLALSAQTYERLRSFVRNQGLTLNTLVQGAWLLLLQRYTGQQRVVCGVTVAGRPAELMGAEERLGLFINTLPLITAPRPDTPIQAWLQELQQQNLIVREHQYSALSDVQRWAGRPGEALFDTLLVFENFPIASALAQSAPAGLEFSVPQSLERTNYPLTLAAVEEDGLQLTWSYRRECFNSASITRLAGHFQRLLVGLVQSPAQALGELAMLDDAEIALQREIWNPVTPVLAPGPCVHQLIERQAALRPAALALICAGETLTYDELNVRANRLAHRLRALGATPEMRIGLAVERSVDMVVGLLAILKAGAAYVPLDPDYPAQRLAYLMDDSGIALLVTQSCVRDRLPWSQGRPTLELDRTSLAEESGENLPNACIATNLAYLIYTSGSTGRPKGVAVAHGPLAMHCLAIGELYGMTPEDRELQFASISFDGAHERWLTPLIHGSTLMPRDNELWSVERTCAEIERWGITIACFTPSYLLQLAQYLGDSGRRLPIRSYTVGGEGMPRHAFAEVQRLLKPPRIINGYGPTETVITPLLWCAYPDTSCSAAFLPIGRPVGRRSAYVLDGTLEPLPVGVSGELMLGGEGVARGYHQRPALTAERFVPDPLAVGGRLYRSGDLARLRDDGVVEYLGRLDQQVKIRGFRIEPGEIEACLLEHPGVRESWVVDQHGSSGPRLVGYLVPSDPQVSATQLRAELLEWLRARLPAHLVPAELVTLSAFPLSPSGKRDRLALPLQDNHRHADDLIAASTSEEELLADIWRELLGLQAIGMTENFFDLGGDSIISLQVVSRAARRGLAFTPRQLFEAQSIRALAQVAKRQVPARASTRKMPFALAPAAAAIPREDLEDLYPLSPMQQGMLFHCHDAPELNLYVNQLSVSVEGLEPQRFAIAWSTLLQRHPILRTAFVTQPGVAESWQAVQRNVELPLTLLDWRDRNAPEAALRTLAEEDQARGFRFEQAPLWRLTLVRLAERRYQLIWTYHHLLLDGWSASRLLGDMLRVYAGKDLANSGAGYVDYIAWLGTQDAKAAETFWRHRLAPLEAPTLLAKASGAVGSGHGVLYSYLDASAIQRLQRFAMAQRITLNTLVQGAWLLLLQRHTGQRTLTFGATVAGRPAALEGAEELLGLFINTLPVIQTLNPEQRLGDWLRELQSFNLEVRDYEHTPLADIQRWAGHGGQALFDSIIVFENHPVDRALRGEDASELSFSEVGSAGVTNVPMDLMVSASEQGLEIEYLYLRSRFSDREVEAIRAQLEGLLDVLPMDEQRRLGDIGLPGGAPQLPERLPACCDLLLSFQRQVEDHPDRTALICGDVRLSYAELENRSRILAGHLRARGMGPERIVAVALSRSVTSLVAYLAVLRVGAAYLPLDMAYPSERLAMMLEDCGASLVLCEMDDVFALAVAAKVPSMSVAVADTAPPLTPVTHHPEHLAYLIYTSGSTGRPKGVAVARGAIEQHCRDIVRRYQLSGTTRELLFMSFAFDGAQERWLSVLSAGGRLVLRDETLWTPEQTLAVLEAEGIDVACFPPAYLQQLAEAAEFQGRAPAVHTYCFGGDAVPEALFERVKRALRPVRLVNGYGPTETVVTPLLWQADLDTSCLAAYAPIGHSVAGRGLYVLDADLNPVPPGVDGELYLGGECLARGYLGRAGLTAERFLADPFAGEGARLYRTGDRVRQRADGTVDYLGRLDQQVKIRGFRIEPGEIEACLRTCPGVQDAAVVAVDTPAGKRLVGYVASVATALREEQLKAHLHARLPEHLVPSRILMLARLPLSANGKLDRRALPAPQWEGQRHRAPRNALEEALVTIWQEVLGIARVGIDDNFFELGGDSLQVLKVIARVRARQELGIDLKLRDLIKKPTVAALSGYQELSEKHSGEPDLLLGLNTAAPGRPLFCLHAGYGTVFDYEALARHLDGRVPVLGLQCRMLLEPDWSDLSLASMAEAYADHIRRRQPEGPYRLLGWSLGATLAILVARLLERNGDQVEFLGLVDSYVPGLAAASDWREDLQEFLVFLLEATPTDVQRWIADCPSDADVIPIVAQALQAKTTSAGPMGLLDAAELGQVFSVGARLKALAAAQGALPATQVASHCWWTVGREAERQRFDAQTGRHVLDRVLVGGHYELLQSQSLLQELETILRVP